MNSYELSRTWFNWCFDNPDKSKPIHTAIYFFSIEHCNRLGWKEKFGFPSQMVMEALGIKNWRTYSKALNELVQFGFINMIEISKNQYSSNIIAIVKNTKAPTKALDKALHNHSTKQSQSIASIDKQITSKQITSKQEVKEKSIQEKIDGFIEWFNAQKKKHTGTEGQTRGLSTTDENNLKKLLKVYTFEDFGKAIPNMFANQWAKDTNNLVPSHFLRVDNFNKYLNTDPKKSNHSTFDDKGKPVYKDDWR